MRILMVSPHPTYSPRGTPISVLNRCRALSALGHQVDLVTYGIGQDVPLPGLRWLRAPVPGIRTVKIGPSPAKVPLNIAVFVRTVIRAVRGKYDVIHTHEEAGILGGILSPLLKVPHVYDMGNDLSVVLTNYGFGERHPLTRLAVAIETFTVRRSAVVIAHFPVIAERVRHLGRGRTAAQVVPNVPLEHPAIESETQRLRAQWSPDGLPVALYTGSLEDYQGLPAMIEAIALLHKEDLDVRLVLVGGRQKQQEHLRGLAADAGVNNLVQVAGLIDQSLMASCMQAADVLVSPRASGSNTPLKIFSYMHSGRPILATDIESHTQVLDASSAELVAPAAQDLADGLQRLLIDPDRAGQLASRAAAVAEASYSASTFIAAVADAYAVVGAQPINEVSLRAARDALSAAFGQVSA